MRHVYVHVPFCRRRCSYCDFAIAVRRTIPDRRYVEAVQAEYRIRTGNGDWDPEPLETLYLGGGTPSLLSPQAVGDLVALMSAEAPAPPWEVTLEANPDDVTLKAARAWRACGINRISLGVQSFQAGVLDWMHRTHAPSQARRAVEALREAGFDNLSLDLIFALPEAVAGDFRRDLDFALGLEPQHLSVYGLSVEPRTPLERWIARGRIAPAPEGRYAEEFLLAHQCLSAAGFEHYEVSNYAKPGFCSRHNQAYWKGAPYAGLGPSAHSYAAGVRRWNLAPWAAYERAVNRGELPEAGREVLAPAQQRLERQYLGLRTSDGISLEELPPEAAPVIEAAVGEGLLQVDRGRVVATARGWLALDELAVRLTTSAEGG